MFLCNRISVGLSGASFLFQAIKRNLLRGVTFLAFSVSFISWGGYGTVTVVNSSGSGQVITLKAFYTNAPGCSSFMGDAYWASLAPGASWSHYANWNESARWGINDCCLDLIGNQILGQTLFYTGSGSCGVGDGISQTNHYCIYNVNWDNPSSTPAHLKILFGSATYFQDGGVAYVRGGGSFDRSFTNTYNPTQWAQLGSTCPRIEIYNMNEPDESKQKVVDQAADSSGSTATSPGAASGGVGANGGNSGSSTNKDNPIQGLTGTNAPTQGDMGAAAAAIIDAIGHAGASGNARLDQVNTNLVRGFGGMSNTLTKGFSDLTNAVSGDSGSSTNGLNTTNLAQEVTLQAFTNEFTRFVSNNAFWNSNLYVFNSNSLYYASNSSYFQSNEDWAERTFMGNAFGDSNLQSYSDLMREWGTNEFGANRWDDAAYGNFMTHMDRVAAGATNMMQAWGMHWDPNNRSMTNFSDFMSAKTSLGSASSELASRAAGVSGGSEFLVLKVLGLNNEELHSWDFKPAVNLETLNDKVGGIKAWFKLVVLWAAIFYVINWFSGELRQGLVQAMTVAGVPGVPVGLVPGGGVPGMVAQVGAVGVGMTRRAIGKVLLVAACVFIGSIMVGLASTVITAMGSDTTFLAANATGVISSAPSLLWNIVFLISSWFPIVELMILGLNTLLAQLVIDGCVDFLVSYAKVVQ